MGKKITITQFENGTTVQSDTKGIICNSAYETIRAVLDMLYPLGENSHEARKQIIDELVKENLKADKTVH